MAKSKSPLDGFMDFVKEQGVVGLAVGITVGVAAATMVGDVVAALVTPIIGLILGGEGISDALVVELGDDNAPLRFGLAIDAIIRFMITAFAVYLMVRAIGADKWK